MPSSGRSRFAGRCQQPRPVHEHPEQPEPLRPINSIYWQVSPSAVKGVLDQIRTGLTQLVAELRANMTADEAIPSADEASQAVNVIVTGGRSKVRVTTAQARGSAVTANASGDERTEESGFWTRWRKIGAFAVGVASIAGTAFAAIEVL